LLEALRLVFAQGPFGLLRSISLLIRVLLTELSFVVIRLIPAVPVTMRALHYCDERNSAYHLYGRNRPGVLPIYAHGGLWGASSARYYAGLGSRMALVFDGPVFVVAQNVWPEGDMLWQAGDVANVVREAQRRYPGRKSVLVGHSSGAHSSAIALVDGSIRCCEILSKDTQIHLFGCTRKFGKPSFFVKLVTARRQRGVPYRATQ